MYVPVLSFRIRFPSQVFKYVKMGSATSLFRALGLSLLYAAFSPQYREERKVALTRDRRLAAFQCIFHLFPPGLSMALAYLNINSYHIGGELAAAQAETESNWRLCSSLQKCTNF
jgi:hypothetical protein